MSTAVIWSKSKPEVESQYGGHLGEFNGMSSHSHLPHCRVLPLGEFNGMASQIHVSLCRVGLLPLGEFTVVMPEPHPHCRVQSPDEINVMIVPQCKNSFRHIENFFAIIYFFFLMLFGLWWAAPFISSPIHLFEECLDLKGPLTRQIDQTCRANALNNDQVFFISHNYGNYIALEILV